MSDHLTNLLLAVMAVCLIKLAFFENSDLELSNTQTVQSNWTPPMARNASYMQASFEESDRVFVYTPWDEHSGNRIPLLVRCVNCNQ